MHYVTTDKTGRILVTTDATTVVFEQAERSTTDPKTGEEVVETVEIENEERCHAGDGEFEFEFPPGFDFAHQDDWLIVDGELICDPLPCLPASPVEKLQANQSDVDAAICALYELTLGGEA